MITVYNLDFGFQSETVQYWFRKVLHMYRKIRDNSDLFEGGKGERYGSKKYSRNPKSRSSRRGGRGRACIGVGGKKRKYIYRYEAEQRMDIETSYGKASGALQGTLCRTRVDTRQRKWCRMDLVAHARFIVLIYEMGDASLTLVHVACRAAVYPCYCPGYLGSPVTSRCGCALCARPPFPHQAELAQLGYPRCLRLRFSDHHYGGAHVDYNGYQKIKSHPDCGTSAWQRLTM